MEAMKLTRRISHAFRDGFERHLPSHTHRPDSALFELLPMGTCRVRVYKGLLVR